MTKCLICDTEIDNEYEHFLFYEKRRIEVPDGITGVEQLSFDITVYHCSGCLIYRLEEILKLLKNPPRKAKRIINGVDVNDPN